MTDKEYKAEVKRVKDILDKWRDILGLHKDRFSFSWVRESNRQEPNAVADVTASWEYRNHHVNVYLPESQKLDKQELEECLVHELCHVLLSPLWDSTEGKSQAEIEKNEYATTSVAYAILWAYEAGQLKKDRKA